MGVSLFPPAVVTRTKVDRMVVDFNVVILVVDIVSEVFVVVVVCLTDSVEINVKCGIVVILIVTAGFDETFVVDKNDMETFTGVSMLVIIVVVV